MHTTRFLTALTIGAASAVVAASPAAADVPPVTGGAECHMSVKKTLRHDLLLRFPGGLPGISHGGDGPTALEAAGTVTFRSRLTPWAVKIAKRYRKTRLIVIFVVEREDGRFWSIPAENKRTVLIR